MSFGANRFGSSQFGRWRFGSGRFGASTGGFSLAAIQSIPSLLALYLPGIGPSLDQKSDCTGGQTTISSPTNKIGFLGDMKSNMAVGSRIDVNGDFTSNISGWTSAGGVSSSWSNGSARIEYSTAAGGLFQDITSDSSFFEVLIAGTSNGASPLWICQQGSFLNYSIYSVLSNSFATSRIVAKKTAGSSGIRAYLYASSAGVVTLVDSLAVRPMAGNHAIQTSDVARAVLGLTGGIRTSFFPTGTLMSTYIALNGGYVLVAVPGVGPVWSTAITTTSLDLAPSLIGAAGAAGIAVLSSMPDDATKALLEVAFRKLAFTGVL